MSEPRQFRRDPATGDFREDEPRVVIEDADWLAASPPAAWVCPSCQTVSVGPRCVKPECGWTPPEDDPPGGSD